MIAPHTVYLVTTQDQDDPTLTRIMFFKTRPDILKKFPFLENDIRINNIITRRCTGRNKLTNVCETKEQIKNFMQTHYIVHIPIVNLHIYPKELRKIIEHYKLEDLDYYETFICLE